MSNDKYTVTAIFNCNKGDADKFIDWLKSDKQGIGITKEWKGYVNIDFYRSEDDNDQIILWEVWDNKESYESYLKMRTETGAFDIIGPWLSKPATIIKHSNKLNI